MPHLVFDSITARRTLTGPCPSCAKKVRRSRTFEQTVNPFNRNDDGTPKTTAEVRQAVEAEADAWQPDFHHEACKEALR